MDGRCPKKASWGCTFSGGIDDRWSRPTIDHFRTLRTSPAPMSIRYPMTPCSPGVSPVQIEVIAVAVVDGAIVVRGDAAIEVNVGVMAVRACHCSHPRPS